MTNELEALALAHGSDKASHGYCALYEDLFAPLRDRPVRLLELGVGGFERPDDPAFGGASLRMWRDYFPRGEVVGLDLYDKSGVAGERITVVQGRQEDEALLARLVAQHGPFDIVIDDASHIPALTRRSFELLFPTLADGGIYVLEDVATSYWPLWGGRFRPSATGTTMAMVKRRLDGLNHAEFKLPRFRPDGLDTSVLEVRARHNIVALTKGANTLASDLNRPHPVELGDWLRGDLAPVLVDRVRQPVVMRTATRIGVLPALGRLRRRLVPEVRR
jgi:demethylmacrocin O-methyltransferase